MRTDGDEDHSPRPVIEHTTERATLCVPHFDQDRVVHRGDEGFTDVLCQYFPAAESAATERLVVLKDQLRAASTHDFWAILMEEMCSITESQCGFVAKRMLVDDQDSAVEMPAYGEPGSCLMGVAFYVNNSDVKQLYRDYRYHAYGTPCEYMKYDKVFIVPERMMEFVRDNPNAASLPWERSEAFIGVPLFSEGKCFAHIGLIWSSEGASRRKLGWTFIEMFLHSLEDMILQRILEGRGFAKEVPPPDSAPAKVIPISAITASQSLKPYARSLSHELRTPMQGVVGMLDIMYATVIDAISSQQNDRVRSVFSELKKHIEVVQDSSRRAVEAADNVVHAYDLNMQMPETPLTPDDSDLRRILGLKGTYSSRSGSPMKESIGTSTPLSKKRSRDAPDFHPGPPLKKMFKMTQSEFLQDCESQDGSEHPTRASTPVAGAFDKSLDVDPLDLQLLIEKRDSGGAFEPATGRNNRPLSIRDFMRNLLNDILRSSHPAKAVHTEVALGELIELRNLGPRGEVQDRIVQLEVERDVPEIIVTDEHHLQFAIQKIVDNALKFTEDGRIKILVRLGRNPQMVEICVADTGCGIAEDAQHNLFKPHFQEDAAINRSRDGLGLSLFNAKAHVRKNLGGDVTLERSTTDGPAKGSEFLIRLPISATSSITIDSFTYGTPSPASLPTRPTLSSSPSLSSKPTSASSTSTLPTPDLPVSNPLPPATTTATTTAITTTTKPSPPRSRPRRIPFNPTLALTQPLNILIAEDNAINRNVAIGSLSKLGYTSSQITIAFDGVEAVRHYKKNLLGPKEMRFDLVLMDIWMPNCDGYEATKRILEMEERKRLDKEEEATETDGLGDARKGNNEKEKSRELVIVAVTADITGDCAVRAKEVGMKGFLAKPFKVVDLEKLILRHFD